jgi:uracil permease
VDFTKSRNIIIAALILGLTVGIHFSGALGFDPATGTNGTISFVLRKATETSQAVKISLSGLSVGALVGIVLNAILPGNDYQFGKNAQGDTSVNFKV